MKNLRGNCKVQKCFQNSNFPVSTTCSIPNLTPSICSQHTLTSSPLHCKVFSAPALALPASSNRQKIPYCLRGERSFRGELTTPSPLLSPSETGRWRRCRLLPPYTPHPVPFCKTFSSAALGCTSCCTEMGWESENTGAVNLENIY